MSNLILIFQRPSIQNEEEINDLRKERGKKIMSF